MKRTMLSSILAALIVCWSLPAAAEALNVPYTIRKPEGDGPFPAVVLMHDCSGLGPRSSGAPFRWSSDLAQRGYVTIWPDSFTSRGYPDGVCMVPPPRTVTMPDRVRDAYAALRHLRSLPFVDPKRIAIMGGSHGGSATLASIVDVGNPNRLGPHGFAAAVALYPACGSNFGPWKVERGTGPGAPITGYTGVFKPAAPLLIVIGEKDDWTPAEPCRRLAEGAQAAGFPVDIKIYPGVHHSFDGFAQLRYVEGRINQNSPTGRGATVAGNAEAWKDAVVRVTEFLAKNFAK